MKLIRTIFLVSIFCLWSQGLASADSFHEEGPYSVKTEEHRNIRDQNRGRKVPMKLFWGEGAAKGHLVVLSHGAGGNWDSHYALATHLASHGYVVVAPEHVFSNTNRLRKIRREVGLAGAFKSMTRNPEANLQRPRDISFCIDQATSWNRSHSTLRNRIQTDRVGLIGHSFGAYTTLVVCGARPLLDYLPNSGTGLGNDMSDSRVSFGLALSPQAPGEPFFSKESYRTINRPLIGVSGTHDRQQGANRRGVPANRRKKSFKHWPAGNKVFLWLENADHLAFTDETGSTRRKRRWRGSKVQEDVTKIVKATALLAGQVYLRRDSQSRRQFRASTLRALCGKQIPSLEWLER